MPVPSGVRTAIPIVGGEFLGPRLKGRVLDLGADWGLTDPKTGIFSADTRYQLHTYDGAWIYIRTSGSTQPGGESHLRVVFETGDSRYYWLNSVVGKYLFFLLLVRWGKWVLENKWLTRRVLPAIGVLRPVLPYEGGNWLQIDVWNVSQYPVCFFLPLLFSFARLSRLLTCHFFSSAWKRVDGNKVGEWDDFTIET